MRPIGFSTGALAYSDFRRGLEMTRRQGLRTIELSALRQNELVPLLDALDTLDLTGVDYTSIHAPSQYEPSWEGALCERLQKEIWRGWPVVVHPDAIRDFALWRELGPMICVENMDNRKLVGRRAQELAVIFERLPEAGLCFDIGHASQVDSTMAESYLILRDFGSRLRQVHVSEVSARSKHDPLSYCSILAFQDVAGLIPSHIPLILETPVAEEDMTAEVAKVREALPLDKRSMVA
jgi:sugar phosphate isomerase/epimerase